MTQLLTEQATQPAAVRPGTRLLGADISTTRTLSAELARAAPPLDQRLRSAARALSLARACRERLALRREARVVVHGQFVEKLAQFLAIGFVQRGEELVLDRLHDRAQPRELPLAVSGERDGVAAAVLGIAAPFDQAALFQGIEQSDELAAVYLKRVGDRRLRLARPLGEEREESVVVAAEAGVVELLHRVLLDREAEPAQQEQRAGHKLARHTRRLLYRSRYHGISVAHPIVCFVYRGIVQR